MKGEMYMGLDMYVYKVDKLNEDEVLKLIGARTCDIRETYHYIDKETFDADPDMYGDLIPYISEVPVIDIAFDYKRCFADHGIDADPFREKASGSSAISSVHNAFGTIAVPTRL